MLQTSANFAIALNSKKMSLWYRAKFIKIMNYPLILSLLSGQSWMKTFAPRHFSIIFRWVYCQSWYQNEYKIEKLIRPKWVDKKLSHINFYFCLLFRITRCSSVYHLNLDDNNIRALTYDPFELFENLEEISLANNFIINLTKGEKILITKQWLNLLNLVIVDLEKHIFSA